MHSVGRSPEPALLSQLRSSLSQWTELQGTDRQHIRGALAQDFGAVCGYCEQPCRRPTPAHDGRNEETIDHFRPRCKFPDLWLDWLNLIYACHRCNQAKNSNWPTPDDVASQLLAQMETRYTGVSEYVNPNAGSHSISADGYFEFQIPSGAIKPQEGLDDVEWSKARRTIADIDLNDSELGLYDERHLCNRRRSQVKRLNEALRQLNTFEEQFHLMREFTLPEKPFSSFVAAYIIDRFPSMERIFRDDALSPGA